MSYDYIIGKRRLKVIVTFVRDYSCRHYRRSVRDSDRPRIYPTRLLRLAARLTATDKRETL